MNHYLDQLEKIIEISRTDVDGILLVNKDGYVEYYKPCESRIYRKMANFGTREIGKHILELYPELNEENSTVMETLRTGKTIVGKKQSFTWEDNILTIMSVTYPIMENDEILGAIDAAKILEVRKKDESRSLDQTLYYVDDIITNDSEMERLKDQIKMVARSESPVLIYGETGTGKELFAESLHTAGTRRNKAFISQNCAAIPSNLLESIFFGTEKGGFTGAESRKGIFELANGGTLFLDELNSMDLAMQAKLLKAIEEKKIRRIGGKEHICVDVRIVCAMNEDPDRMMEEEKLRVDLYYRIGVICLEVPPLRDREGDVELLTEHYIKEYNQRMNRRIQGLSYMTKQLFEKWVWPGNIRELRNTIESAFNVEQSDRITISSVQDLLRREEHFRKIRGNGEETARREDLDTDKCDGAGTARRSGTGIFADSTLEQTLESGSLNLKDALENYERYILKYTLRRERQLIRVAEKLEISPQKLQYRMEKLGLKATKSKKFDY